MVETTHLPKTLEHIQYSVDHNIWTFTESRDSTQNYYILKTLLAGFCPTSLLATMSDPTLASMSQGESTPPLEYLWLATVHILALLGATHSPLPTKRWPLTSPWECAPLSFFLSVLSWAKILPQISQQCGYQPTQTGSKSANLSRCDELQRMLQSRLTVFSIRNWKRLFFMAGASAWRISAVAARQQHPKCSHSGCLPRPPRNLH